MLGPWGDRFGQRIAHRPGITLTIALSVVAGAASFAIAGYQHHPQASSACTRQTAGTSVASGPPAAVAAGVAQALFGCAPSVVVANADSPADVAAAVPLAEQAHAPLLLSPLASSAANTASYLRGPAGAARARLTSSLSTVALQEINDLHPRSVLAVGLTTAELSSVMPGARVTTAPSGLPAMARPKPLSHVAVLVPAGRSAASLAASATAEAAGATVVPVHGYDPRGDPAAIAALARIRPRQVIAAGGAFGPAGRLSARLAVAQTGVQLPRGGQLVVPMHRIVALYGHPGTPSLGALGQQGIKASVTRAKQVAAHYNALSKVPVVPAFEIIAAVATSAPGPDGTYSYETPVAALRPWVAAAARAGMYVILDLQPGRANFLAEAKVYQPLLELPNVGLALDPEWKLQPGQLPLHQIGSVSITEVNSVVNWLAQLTAEYHLPQKLLELHQFRIGEIQNEQLLDTRNDDLAVVMNMDGQGTPAMKQLTWDAVTSTAPPGVNFGWKNFYVKDQPMLTPSQTMSKTPGPVVISYQ
jgi:hypothetical protein